MVQPELLQQALDKAVEKFPAYLVVMKSGAFWYYFEETGQKPKVVPEKPGRSAVRLGRGEPGTAL